MGDIITFYSYKGGTGRTMAMANVAWILAASGRKVLAVDWDLEAPGIHRYFHPFLRDKDLASSTGIIDLVIDFAVQATTPPSTDEDKKKGWYLPYADVLRHAVSIDWDFGKGRLDLLPAGQQNASYATRVNSFNWDNFYERLGGGTFLDALRDSMRAEYDYVLVDSRTGVSDTSGICTVQMPDKIVVCFTLNRQSIEGASSVARSVVEARSRAGRRNTQVFPVPTRVEKGETERLDAARTASRERFDEFLGHLPEATPDRYWAEVEVGYQSYYAFEEVLATFSDPTSHVGSLLRTMEKLTARLTGKHEVSWVAPAPDRRAEVLAKYGWARPTLPDAPSGEKRGESSTKVEPSGGPGMGTDMTGPQKAPPPDDPVQRRPLLPESGAGRLRTPGPGDVGSEAYWLYISYSPANRDALLERFISDLSEEVRLRVGLGRASPVTFFDMHELKLGEHWERTITEALGSSRTGVCLVSPRYLHSDHCGREFAVMVRRGMPILPVTWVPLGYTPSALAHLQWTGPGAHRVMTSGLRAMMRLTRYRDKYHEYVSSLGELIVRYGHYPQPPRLDITSLSEFPNAFDDDKARSPTVGQHVVAACIAPTATQAKAAGLPAGSYGRDEWTWRPVGNKTVDELVDHAAEGEMFYIERFPLQELSVDELYRAAEERGQMVLIIVDAKAGNISDLEPPLRAMSSRVSPLVRVQTIPPNTEGEDELTANIKRHLLTMRSVAIRESTARRAPTSPIPAMPKIAT
jgi:MinD-like ATPase involved in chromosome partitioning or flagellar assembly